MKMLAQGEIDPSNSGRLVNLANDADAVLPGPGLVSEAPIAELRSELLSRAAKPVFILDASAFTSLRTPQGIAPVSRKEDDCHSPFGRDGKVPAGG
jgi:ADP-dependent NAD(P)H-hydrate dehydratase